MTENTDKEQLLLHLLTVDKWTVNEDTGCWEWIGTLYKGYGRVSTRVNSKPVESPAPRVALRSRLNRPIQKGMLACHTCDNSTCVNPIHIYEGTPKQNTADMMTRNRHNDSFLKGGLATRKLTYEEAVEIRKLASEGLTYREIKSKYSISVQSISNIVTGKIYGFDNVDARGLNTNKWRHRAARSLTEDQVRMIRKRVAQGEPQTRLVKELDLDSSTVSRIINKKLYKDVEDTNV